MRTVLALALTAASLTMIGVAGYRCQRAIAVDGNALVRTDQFRPYNITFERTACFGICPDFVLMIDHSGNVRLQVPAFAEAESEEPRPGQMIFETTLSHARYAALTRRFDTGGFRKLKLDYSVMVTDGPSTTIAMDSPLGHWATQVYMVPCASEGLRRNAESLRQMGITEFVPDIFCDLSSELDEIACDAYLHGKRINPADALKPFRPPHCRSPR